MLENDPNPQLELVVPWDLPIEQKLSEAEQSELSQALNQLLEALKEPFLQEALIIIDQSLITIGTPEVIPVEVSSTKTSLEYWEVKDFDNYFDISHIETQDSALCVVRSLLVAYKMFIILCSQCSSLDPTQVELQKRGFASYAHLLARVFHLHLKEI